MGWHTRKDGRHYQASGHGVDVGTFGSIAGQDKTRHHEHQFISTYLGWQCRICGMPKVPSASEKGKRYVYGTRLNKWYLVGPSDRDYRHGLTREQFHQLHPDEAKTEYTRPRFV